jgi:hypothetical protein
MANVRVPETFIDAKGMIEDSLNEGMKLSVKSYGSMFSNLADILHFHIEDADHEGYANIDLFITYKLRVMGNNDLFETVEKTRNLRVLNSLGDTKWTYRMINKIWDGDYPSTIAVDMETGEVFFFNVRVNRIVLEKFGKMAELQFETFIQEINDREPFRIRISDDAMFDFIDGSEGINHLQRNIYVEFNCGLPIRVSNMPALVL